MKKLRDVTANKKKRTKQIVEYTVINLKKQKAIQEGERELQRNKEAKINKLARKRETTVKKKAAVKIKKTAKAAGKKSNKKDKKANYLIIINKAEKAIALLFQDINYGDPNKIEV